MILTLDHGPSYLHSQYANTRLYQDACLCCLTLNLADFFTKLNDRIIFDQQYAMIQYIPTGEEPQEA